MVRNFQNTALDALCAIANGGLEAGKRILREPRGSLDMMLGRRVRGGPHYSLRDGPSSLIMDASVPAKDFYFETLELTRQDARLG